MTTAITPYQELKDQSVIALRSGFLPKSVDTPEKAITIALKGKEIGMPPMQAFSHIHVIQGKPTISSEGMLALIYKNCPGAVINYLETSTSKCTIEVIRPGHKPAVFSFTIEEAKLAGLLNKDSWQKYAPAMLRARVIAIAARAVFPDAIMGCSYTPEEMGAEVDEDGETKTAPKEIDQTEEQRKELSSEIMKTAKAIGMTSEALKERAMEVAGVPGKDMTVLEMEGLLENLQIELGTKNGKTPATNESTGVQ